MYFYEFYLRDDDIINVKIYVIYNIVNEDIFLLYESSVEDCNSYGEEARIYVNFIIVDSALRFLTVSHE